MACWMRRLGLDSSAGPPEKPTRHWSRHHPPEHALQDAPPSLLDTPRCVRPALRCCRSRWRRLRAATCWDHSLQRSRIHLAFLQRHQDKSQSNYRLSARRGAGLPAEGNHKCHPQAQQVARFGQQSHVAAMPPRWNHIQLPGIGSEGGLQLAPVTVNEYSRGLKCGLDAIRLHTVQELGHEIDHKTYEQKMGFLRPFFPHHLAHQ